MPPYFYKYGEKGSGFRAPTASAVQDYEEIKQKCLKSGQLFEDPVFQAIPSNIFYSTKRGAEFKWLRPKEIVENPEFISDAANWLRNLSAILVIKSLSNSSLYEFVRFHNKYDVFIIIP
ncbi:hypothetical protein B4U80_14114 [Leptotrombidium deliense]|uniref:Calpain catalytic domain-containing protein n=1 Tax=Leptotrombidium deliense TaxID=299467 RepID=A0A443S2B8_9ACAR|nr:hypothetical protein B4U80_14114 [Leptotrombidium deliense]